MEKTELSAVTPLPGTPKVTVPPCESDEGGTMGGSTEPARLMDGRKVGEWQSRWPSRVWIQVSIEAIYLVILMVLAFSMLGYAWFELPQALLSSPSGRAADFIRYWHYAFAGLLGGTVFAMKWLYHSVAKGSWNVDRIIWRLLSPWIAFSLAFAVGVLMTSGSVATKVDIESASGWMSLGFLVGLFSDTAVGKMQEVAYVLFGGPRSPSKE